MAKAASLADSLGKQLECAVCLEQYTEPKVLPCLHSFCKRCLQRLLTPKGAVCKISCPTCRSSVEIPQGEVDLLPANFFVNNLLSVVALHEESGSTSLECDNCDSGDPPVNRCATCSHFLCEFCSQAHRRARNTNSHRLMSLEAKKMGSAAVTRPAICKEHEGEMIKLFCETCEEAICRDCTIVKHRDHKYTFVKDVFVKGKESLLKILSETKPKAVVLKEAIDGVLQMKKNVNSHAQLTVREVVKCFEDLNKCLDIRCIELVTGIETLQRAKLKSLDIQQETLETALASVQSSLDFTEKALENGSEVEILNMRKQMSNRLQGLNSSSWELEPSVNEGLTFKADYQLKQIIASFGVVTDVVTSARMSTVSMGNGEEGVMYNTLCGQQVKFNIFSKEYSGKRRQEGGDIFNVTVDCVDSAGGSLDLPVYPQVEDHGNGTYSFYLVQNRAGLHKLSVQLKDYHVQGSPFTWAVEKWNLEVFSSDKHANPTQLINLSKDKLTAHAQLQYIPQSGLSSLYEVDNYGQVDDEEDVGFQPGFCYREWDEEELYDQEWDEEEVYAEEWNEEEVDDEEWGEEEADDEEWGEEEVDDGEVNNYYYSHQLPVSNAAAGPYVVGSVGFKRGKHLWKVEISGQIQNGCSFGIVNTTRCRNNKLLRLGASKWVCCPKQENNITLCSGDIVELYLNIDSERLMMYNPRTSKSVTLHGVEGEVSPVFHLATNGDKVSLKIPKDKEDEAPIKL